ncbi:hypothetical protein VTO42DRAFT_2589 [Malbranchea cinnamomea]
MVQTEESPRSTASALASHQAAGDEKPKPEQQSSLAPAACLPRPPNKRQCQRTSHHRRHRRNWNRSSNRIWGLEADKGSCFAIILLVNAFCVILLLLLFLLLLDLCWNRS